MFNLIIKTEKGKYVGTKDMNVEILARIQISEYYHLDNNNIKAINIRVTAFSGANELKKLKNSGFLQVYSNEKQVLIYIDKILAKLKTLKESEGGDFSLRTFEDIEKDESLEEVHRNIKNCRYKKVKKSFKSYTQLKVRPSQPDLVCQKYHFVSTQKPVTNQVRVVAVSLPQLTQASFLQKNQTLQNHFLISETLRWHRVSVACKNQSF